VVESTDLGFIQLKFPPWLGIGNTEFFNDLDDPFASFFPLFFELEESIVCGITCLADVGEDTVFTTDARSFGAVGNSRCW